MAVVGGKIVQKQSDWFFVGLWLSWELWQLNPLGITVTRAELEAMMIMAAFLGTPFNLFLPRNVRAIARELWGAKL